VLNAVFVAFARYRLPPIHLREAGEFLLTLGVFGAPDTRTRVLQQVRVSGAPKTTSVRRSSAASRCCIGHLKPLLAISISSYEYVQTHFFNTQIDERNDTIEQSTTPPSRARWGERGRALSLFCLLLLLLTTPRQRAS
jgi:hypothetical protein